MAFNSFGNTGAASISQGPTLPEVQTEGLGFLSLAGDAKLRLSTPWSPPPAPNASLMSIASRRGLVAAACPDAVVLASTDAVRKAFEAPKNGDSEVRPFTPQLRVPLPIRICQLAFSADEAYLILSAEQGGGLAVYDVDTFQQGTTQSAFEIPTNGESLRALVPNPRPEKAELCAVVTNEGKLLMANLKERNFVFKGTSQILREQVSCVAWSNKGKQLIAGLGDGTLCQLTPEGGVKAEISRPPDLDSSYYVSMVVWLENDLFLVFHVSTSNGPQTRCHMITRQGQSFQYQRLNDPVDPYAAEKIPHHTAVRLKDFPPNLQDLLIFSSSAVPDIGLLARSNTPLSSNGPVNVFTNIELADDSRRAALPMGEDIESLETPAAIGVSLDLSSKDKVYKPIPTDEQDQSPGPLPGYWVLTEQGILSIWWVVYSESIRGGTTYPGLAAVEGGNAESASTSVSQTAQPAPFGASNPSPFGSASASAAPAFGGPSSLGTRTSPWGATPATTNGAGGNTFGSVAFGSTSASKPVFGTSSFGMGNATPITPAFGQPTGPGAKASPWGSGGTSTSTPAFGQVGFTSTNTPSATPGPFGGAASSSPFSTFASQGGFAALGSNTSADKPSIFASANQGNAEAAMDTDASSSFPSFSSKPDTGAGNPFGSNPFKLTSSFKPDTNGEDGDNKTSTGAEKPLFGTAFTSSISEAAKATSNSFGGDQGLFGKRTSNTIVESTTPTTTPSANKFFSQTSEPTSSVPFSFPSNSSGSIFGKVAPKTPAAEPPQPQKTAPADAPLPPESTSKATYPFGDSSFSSASSIDNGDVKNIQSSAEDLPLPPDSPRSTAKPKETTAPTNKATTLNAAPLPPDPVKNKAAYSAPLPPLPGQSVKPKAASDAPLPPDPIKNKRAYANKLPPLPGAFTETKPAGDAPLPPDPVKEPKAYENKLSALPITKVSSDIGFGFKFPTDLPPVSDSEDDNLTDEATEDASEGSGVDVAKDLSPSSTGANRTPGFTPQGSFDDGLGGSYSTISRPEPERRSFFLGHNAPVFPQPNPISPRSPSPVRGALPPRMLGNDQTRSFSAPGMASHILGASRKSTQSRLNSSIVGRDVALENAVMEQQRKVKAKKEAEEERLLVDEDDDAVQQLLGAEIEPTLELDEFIAHSGIVSPAGDSVPAQVEAVYRDINSMIDTLGLNCHSLKAWSYGHKTFSSDDHSKQDLASSDEWTLQDIGQLTYIIDQVLGEALDEARVTDVEEKVAQVQDIQRELARDCNKQADIRKIFTSRLDPEQEAAYQALPLSAEQAAQQSDLRRQLGHFQSSLAQAEENLTLLKAKIVSVNSISGRGGPVPTIEAIVRTITKMTSMVEKRSGDIDVLENQMRKLRLGSTGPAGSREGSPFATPNAKKTLGSSIFSPDRSTREATPMRGSLMRHSLSGSISGIGGDMFRTPPRRKLSGFGDAERKAVKEKRERRTAVLRKLRNSIQAKGPSVLALDDIA
ncbi:hypothetical protein E0Z10_g555 [Xylaria hypoxylon]|uniref:Nucleoporin Nup159/Nup146 N-terminal domain-containing protein n=1 Tax=Xylaria hypoxylon TaxID=37992 RepID=A0A4Z0ZGY1_9PEZI|nr:hypothetical protein E0Z10_g555 [Xylaria hypoxylon]